MTDQPTLPVSAETLLQKLTDKERAFVEQFFLCGFNATEAARRAKYKWPNHVAFGLTQRADVKAAIEAYFAQYGMSKAEIIARIAQIASGTLDDVLTINGKIHVDAKKARRLGKLGIIKSIKETKYGWDVELHDPLRALELLARAQGLLGADSDVNINLLVKGFVGVSPDDWDDQPKPAAEP